MNPDIERYSPSPKPTLLLENIPAYESLRAAIDPIEMSEATYRFKQLILYAAPLPFGLAGRNLDKDDLDDLGVASPEFDGVLDMLISNGAGSNGLQTIGLVHESSDTGFWTEKFEYYLDKFGELRRRDYRHSLFEDDEGDLDVGNVPTWEERDANAEFGESMGINNMHVGVQELATLEKIIAAAPLRRINTQSRD